MFPLYCKIQLIKNVKIDYLTVVFRLCLVVLIYIYNFLFVLIKYNSTIKKKKHIFIRKLN